MPAASEASPSLPDRIAQLIRTARMTGTAPEATAAKITEMLGAERAERSTRRLALAAYCAATGLTSAAAGALASLPLSGTAKLAAWIGVTAAFTIASGWLADTVLPGLEHLMRDLTELTRGDRD